MAPLTRIPRAGANFTATRFKGWETFRVFAAQPRSRICPWAKWRASTISSWKARRRPPPERPPLVEDRKITPGYFATMGVPLLRGRDFTQNDAPRQPNVCIINDTLAHECRTNQFSFCGNRNPAGWGEHLIYFLTRSVRLWSHTRLTGLIRERNWE